MRYTLIVFFTAFLLALIGCGKDSGIVVPVNGPSVKQILQGPCPNGYVVESIATFCMCVSSNDMIECPEGNH